MRGTDLLLAHLALLGDDEPGRASVRERLEAELGPGAAGLLARLPPPERGRGDEAEEAPPPR